MEYINAWSCWSHSLGQIFTAWFMITVLPVIPLSIIPRHMSTARVCAILAKPCLHWPHCKPGPERKRAKIMGTLLDLTCKQAVHCLSCKLSSNEESKYQSGNGLSWLSSLVRVQTNTACPAAVVLWACLSRTTILVFQEIHGKPEQCTLKIMLDKLLKAQELSLDGWGNQKFLNYRASHNRLNYCYFRSRYFQIIPLGTHSLNS